MTPTEWSLTCAEYMHRCAYCLAPEPLTMDHFIPLAKDGANDMSNIVPACLSCNSGKGPRTFLLWFAKRRGHLGSRVVT